MPNKIDLTKTKFAKFLDKISIKKFKVDKEKENKALWGNEKGFEVSLDKTKNKAF